MSYGIQTKKLKRLIDFYSPFNNGEQLKFLTLFKGQQGLLRYLQTSSFQGIDSTSIQQRKSWFGSNSPNPSLTPTLTSLLLSPLSSITLKCYLILSVLCLILQIIQANKEGSIVNITIFIIIYTILISISVFQYSSNKILRKYCQNSSISKVWRDNQRKEILSGELVIGDVVELTAGDYIGADGIIIDGNIKVNQPMSYQQITVQKSNTKTCLRTRVSCSQKQDQFILQQLQPSQPQQMPSPIVLAGSEVIQGDARYVVLCVGKNSRLGYFIQQVHRAAKQRKSEVQKKINQIVFQITKYLILGLILFVVLYICKIVVLVIVTKDIVGQDWAKIVIGLGRGMSLGLMGLPIQQIIGLTLGSIYIKLSIYNTHRIWYKYSKDCGTIRDITTIILANPENKAMINIKKWWNMKQYNFQSYSNSGSSCQYNVIEASQEDSSYSSSNYSKDKYNYNGGNDVCQNFQMMFIQSLRCRDFCPKQVGLKFGSFFIGRNSRFVTYIQQQLGKIADHRSTAVQNNQNIQATNPYKSQVSMQSEQQKEVQIIYLKGNSETMLKQCTHILCPKSCKPLQLTQQLREQIQEKMRKLNISQQPSLITAYIEVNPKHPKFRQSNYKFVMISLISYQQNHDNQQFQSLARMKSMGIGITLVSNSEHMETVALAKQMGIVMIDKPSIRLTGYDFYKVVNGIICRTCKKAICICTDQNKYVPSLKNQDQFNRIYKHLNVLSEANSLQKQALAIGLQSAQEKVCFLGTSIEDVPAMRLSTIGASVTSQLSDPYIENTSQIFLPNSRLLTLQKLINWGHLHYEFCRKYLIFAITPCLVAFISSFVCYLLYNNHCIQLIQFIWVSIVICPFLGVGLVMAHPHKSYSFVGTRNNQPFIDRVSYRHISSQVITQVLIIFLVLFFGPNFIPQQADNIDPQLSDYSSKYLTNSNQTICSGVSESIFNNMEPVYYHTFITYGIYSRHMTIIFNIFVLMQILNYINCYKLKLITKEHSNTLLDNNQNSGSNFGEAVKDKIVIFVAVFVGFGLQVFVVHTAGGMFQLYPNGLTFQQWAISIGLALIVLLVGLIVLQLPYDLDNQQMKGKVWPNRCYNLAVMATVARESLQDLQIDEQLEVKKMAMMNQ